jgi:cysteinyl-tRNA synthetase
VLQAHYRGTLDFSEEALIASEKGLARLQTAVSLIDKLKISETSTVSFEDIEQGILDSLNSDLNTPQAIAQLFELARRVNLINDGKDTIDAKGFEHLNRIVSIYFRGILGIQELLSGSSNHLDSVLQVLIDLRAQAKADKNFALSDLIRDKLKTSGIEIMDSKEGSTWRIID